MVSPHGAEKKILMSKTKNINMLDLLSIPERSPGAKRSKMLKKDKENNQVMVKERVK